MKSFFRKALAVSVALFWSLPGVAAPYSVYQGSITRHGHKYCWYEEGWNGAGWYRCGFEGRKGKGWGGPKGWEGAAQVPRGGGAGFELPPPAPPVSAPGIASERYVEPLRGGAAAGSPAGGSLRR
jgi:hypothetical protein